MLVLILFILFSLNIIVYYFKNKIIFSPSRIIPDVSTDIQHEKFNIVLDNNQSIHGLYFPHDNAKDLFIFSHGTSGNLYHRIKYVTSIQKTLNTSVVLYDYRGYGKSSGNCSEHNLYEDIEIIYNYFMQNYKYDNVILYGSSLGTIPTIHLASKIKCKLVILHAPFISLRQIIPWYLRYLIYFAVNGFDMTEKVKNITSNLLIFHSVDDKLIPYDQSKNIMNYANKNIKKMLVPLSGKHGEMKISTLLSTIRYVLETDQLIS